MSEKKVRFPLIMENGTEVRSIPELQENFSLARVLVYFKEGKLIKWLRDRYANDLADSVEALSVDDMDLSKKLCEIFDIPFDEDTAMDLERAEERNRRLSMLKEYTNEVRFLNEIDNVAFDQDDLYDLLDNNKTTIYLCGDEFIIPLSVQGMTYIGINNPTVLITSKEPVDWDTKNIKLIDVMFDEKYLNILNENQSNESSDEEDNKDQTYDYAEPSISQKAMNEIVAVIDDLVEFTNEFCDDYEIDCSDIEYDDSIEIDPDDYGNEKYEYSSNAKAQRALKEALEEAYETVKSDYDSIASNELCDLVDEVIEKADSKITEFYEDFSDKFADICDLNIEEEESEDYCKNKLTNILEIIERRKNALNLASQADEVINKAFKEAFDNYVGKIKSYYDLCCCVGACSEDDDDESFAFFISDGISALESDINSSISEAVDNIISEVENLVQSELAAVKKEVKACADEHFANIGFVKKNVSVNSSNDSNNNKLAAATEVKDCADVKIRRGRKPSPNSNDSNNNKLAAVKKLVMAYENAQNDASVKNSNDSNNNKLAVVKKLVMAYENAQNNASVKNSKDSNNNIGVNTSANGYYSNLADMLRNIHNNIDTLCTPPCNEKGSGENK